MAIQPYLAMTGAEIRDSEGLPQKIAWMACHFSPYSTGLSNIPETLPKSSMLIVNDRTPVYGHDADLIALQLNQAVELLQCDSVLLDFQRQQEQETEKITAAILGTLSCPVCVTEYYARKSDCPVFLPPPPPCIPPKEYLAPWQGRELWLELALDGTQITVTSEGSKFQYFPLAQPSEKAHREPELCCHYHITAGEKQFQFHLYRTPDDISTILEVCESMGVTRAVGLYQEFQNGNWENDPSF